MQQLHLPQIIDNNNFVSLLRKENNSVIIQRYQSYLQLPLCSASILLALFLSLSLALSLSP